MSLLFDIFVDPFFNYFIHNLTLGRVIMRLISTLTLSAGMYLAFLQPAPICYFGWVLIIPNIIYFFYDVATIHRHTRY